MSEPTKIRMVMACNDPATGNPSGVADMLEFGDALRLYGEGITCRLLNGWQLQIGEMRVQYTGYRSWLGNWCFDGCFVTLADAVRILAYVQQAGWRLEEGPTVLWTKYERKQRINAADLLNMVTGGTA